VRLQYLCYLLEPNICEAILAKIELCKLVAILDDFANNVHCLVTQGHFSEVQLSCACISVVLYNHVKESEHLLFRRVDYQILALRNVKLEQELLLDPFDFGH